MSWTLFIRSSVKMGQERRKIPYLNANRVASVSIDGRPALTLSLPGPDELTGPVAADVSKYISPGLHHAEISRGAGACCKRLCNFLRITTCRGPIPQTRKA